MDLYISMNNDLTWELKAIHYKLSRFSKGVETRLGMKEALVVVAIFPVGIQMEDSEALARVDAGTLIEDANRECVAPQQGASGPPTGGMLHGFNTLSNVISEAIMVEFSHE